MIDDDDDIWVSSDQDLPLEVARQSPPIPIPDEERSRFWTAGRIVLVLLLIAAVIGALIAIFVLGDDGDDDNVSTDDGTEVTVGDVWGHRWEVERIQADDDAAAASWSRTAGEDPRYLDLTVEGQIRFNGCNGGSGPAVLADGILEVRDMISTQMACTGPDGERLMAYDQWMAAFLQSGPTVSRDGDELVLAGADGTIQLSKSAAGDPSADTDPSNTVDPDTPVSSGPDETESPAVEPAALGLWGHRWEVRMVLDADNQPRPLVLSVGDVKPVVDSTVEGNLTISGCNGAGGAVRLEGDRLVADGDWAHTRMACAEDVMEQEQYFETFLSSGPTVSIDDDLLTLSTDDGAVLAVRI